MVTSPSTSLVRWHPARGTVAALITEAGMMLAYAILGRNSNDMGIAVLIGLMVVPILAVVIPVIWTTMTEHHDLGALGFTSRRWLPSLGLGLGLSLLVLLPLLFDQRLAIPSPRWIPMAVAGAVSLFEPLFIFGCLQLRFERDFGILPAIVLAALGFALYHIVYMPQTMLGQFSWPSVHHKVFSTFQLNSAPPLVKRCCCMCNRDLESRRVAPGHPAWLRVVVVPPRHRLDAM